MGLHISVDRLAAVWYSSFHLFFPLLELIENTSTPGVSPLCVISLLLLPAFLSLPPSFPYPSILLFLSLPPFPPLPSSLSLRPIPLPLCLPSLVLHLPLLLFSLSPSPFVFSLSFFLPPLLLSLPHLHHHLLPNSPHLPARAERPRYARTRNRMLGCTSRSLKSTSCTATLGTRT